MTDRLRCGFLDVAKTESGWVCRVCGQVMPENYEAVIRANCTPGQIRAFESSLTEPSGPSSGARSEMTSVNDASFAAIQDCQAGAHLREPSLQTR